MARAKEILCPNCNAPLPLVTGLSKTECKYCGRPVLLEAPTIAPPAVVPPPAAPAYTPPNPHVGVPRSRASKAPLIITLVVLALSVGMSLLIFTFINRTVERSRAASRDVAEQVENQVLRSMDDQVKELEHAFDPAIEQLNAEAKAIRLKAELAREEAEARRSERTKTRTRTAKKPSRPLPETVDDRLVERALARLDASHCPGPGFVVFTMRANPEGRLATVSEGPMHVTGTTFGCIRKVIDDARKKVRFPKSKNGSGPIKRRLEAPGAQGL